MVVDNCLLGFLGIYRIYFRILDLEGLLLFVFVIFLFYKNIF